MAGINFARVAESAEAGDASARLLMAHLAVTRRIEAIGRELNALATEFDKFDELIETLRKPFEGKV